MKKNTSFILGLLLLVTACASSNNSTYHSETLDGYNRGMFEFNYQVDKYVLKPVAEGYLAITNQPIRNRINSVFANILEPVSAANHILQGEISNASVNVSRFVVNSTIGLFGLFDVASDIGLEPSRTGFDDTLATWCVPDGPYIILPFLGPATPRSTVAMVADAYTNPVNIATNSVHSRGDANTIKYSYSGSRLIITRASAMPILDGLEKSSVDYYSAMKSAYLQNRAGKRCFLREDEVTYDFDFGMDE